MSMQDVRMPGLLLTALVLCLSANLQPAWGQLSLGPRIIGEFNNIQGGKAGNSTSRPSFRLGGFAQAEIGRDLVFRPEVYLGVRGGKVKNAGGRFVYVDVLDAYVITDLTAATYTFTYADVAFLFCFAPREVDGRLQFFAGPRLSRLLTARAKKAGSIFSLYPDKPGHRWQPGFALGVGYELDSHLIIGIRFSRDLAAAFRSVKMQNEAIGVEIGYRLGS